MTQPAPWPPPPQPISGYLFFFDIENIYWQIMGEQPATAEALAEQWRTFGDKLAIASNAMRDIKLALTDWETPEAKAAYETRSDDANSYLAGAALTAWSVGNHLEVLGMVMRDGQEDMQELWDEYRAAIGRFDAASAREQYGMVFDIERETGVEYLADGTDRGRFKAHYDQRAIDLSDEISQTYVEAASSLESEHFPYQLPLDYVYHPGGMGLPFMLPGGPGAPAPPAPPPGAAPPPAPPPAPPNQMVLTPVQPPQNAYDPAEEPPGAPNPGDLPAPPPGTLPPGVLPPGALPPPGAPGPGGGVGQPPVAPPIAPPGFLPGAGNQPGTATAPGSVVLPPGAPGIDPDLAAGVINPPGVAASSPMIPPGTLMPPGMPGMRPPASPAGMAPPGTPGNARQRNNRSPAAPGTGGGVAVPGADAAATLPPAPGMALPPGTGMMPPGMPPGRAMPPGSPTGARQDRQNAAPPGAPAPTAGVDDAFLPPPAGFSPPVLGDPQRQRQRTPPGGATEAPRPPGPGLPAGYGGGVPPVLANRHHTGPRPTYRERREEIRRARKERLRRFSELVRSALAKDLPEGTASVLEGRLGAPEAEPVRTPELSDLLRGRKQTAPDPHVRPEPPADQATRRPVTEPTAAPAPDSEAPTPVDEREAWEVETPGGPVVAGRKTGRARVPRTPGGGR